MQKHHLEEFTWQEVESRRNEVKNTIIIPVGSVEQHGAHLPLGTDTYAAISIAERTAEKEDCLIAPPIYYGWSPHHMVLPGTVTVRPEILVELVYDVLESLAQHGFHRFVLLNGHRIVNVPWLQLAAERAKRLLKVKVVVADPAYLSKTLARTTDLGKVGHADEIETSHMLHSYPSVVQMDKAVDFAPPRPILLDIDPSNVDDSLCYVPSSEEEMAGAVREGGGCTGSPSRSSKEKGQDYLEWVTDRLAEAVKLLKED